jgi:hypothetical protein
MLSGVCGLREHFVAGPFYIKYPDVEVNMYVFLTAGKHSVARISDPSLFA